MTPSEVGYFCPIQMNIFERIFEYIMSLVHSLFNVIISMKLTSPKLCIGKHFAPLF